MPAGSRKPALTDYILSQIQLNLSYAFPATCPDICIAGGGIIGLSLALELHHRGARVTVLDPGTPLSQASTAAAGMLAANDPENPPQLSPLSRLSTSLYPDCLARLQDLSGLHVPFQTNTTLQALPHESPASSNSTHRRRVAPIFSRNLIPGTHRFILLEEHSLDPRELARALLAAVRATTIDLRPHTPVRIVRSLDQPSKFTLPPAPFTPSTSSIAPEPGPSLHHRCRTCASLLAKARCSPSLFLPSFPLNSSCARPISMSSLEPPVQCRSAPSSAPP